MRVRVNFRVNMETGQVEEFLVEDISVGSEPDPEHDATHDRIALDVGKVVERRPAPQQVVGEDGCGPHIPARGRAACGRRTRGSARMRDGRLHLLAQAALCFEQAGQLAEAARCREKSSEPAAAAVLFRSAGDLTRAASCFKRAGQIGDAVQCLLELGRAEDAAGLWAEAGHRLEAAWVLAVDARAPLRGRQLLTEVAPEGPGERLRLRLASALCAGSPRWPDLLADAIAEAAKRLPEVSPASEQILLVDWAIQAADQLRRPDLASRTYASAYRCQVPGVVSRWRGWAQSALGGVAGIPERDR